MKKRALSLVLVLASLLAMVPAAYAADLYLNGEKTAELTLRPVEGGTSLD